MHANSEALLDAPSAETLDLSSLLESIPAAALLVDGRHEIVGANWRFRERLHDGERCVGNQCSSLLHGRPAGCEGAPWSCPLTNGSGGGRPRIRLHRHLDHRTSRIETIESLPLGRDTGRARLMLQTFRPLGQPPAEPPGRLVGHSPAMLDLRSQIERMRQRLAPILVFGEPGTERELVARALHDAGPRRDGPFVVIPADASDVADDDGSAWPSRELLRAAEQGTLFVDEVATLPAEKQRGLLAMLAGRATKGSGGIWKGLGGARWIFGSSRPLAQAARRRELLAELTPWIGGAAVEVPPLRERTGDLPLLVLALRPWLVAPREHEIDPSVPAALAPLPLYGNLWELRRRLQDGVLNAGRGPLRAEHLVWSA